MNEHEQSQGETGGFFSLDLAQVDAMVHGGAGVRDLLAYVVLCRGVNRRGTSAISTHGAKSISVRTGMSHPKAEESLNWLFDHGYIQRTEGNLGKGSSKSHQARWLLPELPNPNPIYLSNSLTDGVGAGKDNPPLMRIFAGATNGGGCLRSDAQMDALMVLLHLYRHHDLEGSGGVDPRSGIYRKWGAAKNLYGEKAMELDGTNAALFEIEKQKVYVCRQFSGQALFYIPDDEREDRFWDAVRNLKCLGFLYETVQVWSSDPNGEGGRKADPLYTLYICDRHARESEPYLQREINRLGFKFDVLDPHHEFGPLSEEGNIQSGRFRYIAKTKTGGFPIGIFRLRFRPKTRDTGLGIAAERRRVEEWVTVLKGLTGAPQP
jgi:hypothetical protein